MSLKYIKVQQLHVFLFLIFILIVLISGCSKQDAIQATNNVGDNNDGQLGYVAIYTNAVMFIQWTETNGNILGQLQIASLKNNIINSETHSFNGAKNNSDISIIFSGSIWTDSLSGQTWTGSINGDSLTLVYPAKDGTLQTIVFNSRSITDYNQAIENLQNQGITQANAEAHQKEQKEALYALATALADLDEDISRLASINFDNAINNILESLAHMQNEYIKLKSDASATPLTDYQLNNVVEYDLEHNLHYALDYNLGYNLTNLGYDIEQAQELISRVNDEISTLENYWKNYLMNNSPNSNFNQAIISSTIASAKEQQSQLENRVSDAQRQGDNYYNQGEQLYQTAKDYVSSLKATDSN